MSDDCTCVPCRGASPNPFGLEHCAECCFGSGIEVYDHFCPVAEHREWAVRQFGPIEAAL